MAPVRLKGQTNNISERYEEQMKITFYYIIYSSQTCMAIFSSRTQFYTNLICTYRKIICISNEKPPEFDLLGIDVIQPCLAQNPEHQTKNIQYLGCVQHRQVYLLWKYLKSINTLKETVFPENWIKWIKKEERKHPRFPFRTHPNNRSHSRWPSPVQRSLAMPSIWANISLV